MCTLRPCSIGSTCFNRNRFWLKRLRFPIEHFFNRSRLTHDWQDGGSATRSIHCPSRTIRRIGSTTFASDDELEYMATLLLETETTPATHITGYLKNVVPNLSGSKFKNKFRKKRNTLLADSLRVITRKLYNDAIRENRCLLTCQRTLPIVFNRFNQAQSWLKKLINQTNRKRFFSNRQRTNQTNSTNQKRLIPTEHDLSKLCGRSGKNCVCVCVCVGGGGGIISNRGAREEGRGRPLPSSPFFSPSALVARTFSPFPSPFRACQAGCALS